MYIAFHYRLPGDPVDPKAETAGSYKLFTDHGSADAWISHRKKKTATSPQGGWICFASALSKCSETDVMGFTYVLVGAKMIPCPLSLKAAIVAYLRYKSLPA